MKPASLIIGVVLFFASCSSDESPNNAATPTEPATPLLSYTIVQSYPHDTSSYTQGLEFHNGELLEGTGLEGKSKLYLNIWIGNTRRLLGYATMPGGDLTVDGVVINYTAFGTINVGSPYNLGRTAVHEVGHWLGLYHIWGDEPCGDDFVDDTPKQGGYTSGAPTGFRSSCDNAPDGDMYMNYMDFTNDAAMNLFTRGQKERMHAQFAFGGFRYSLLSSTGLDSGRIEEAPVTEAPTTTPAIFQVYPNPAQENVTVQYNGPGSSIGSVFYLHSASGTIIQKIRLASRTQKIELNNLKSGVYFISGTIGDTKLFQKLMVL